jgi:pimeloyl-ACP methyl ester carboxylesterase
MTAPTRFLDRPEGRLAYDLAGTSGPLVVCVPSMGDLRSEYRFLSARLVAAGFRVLSLDVRGHGESAISFTDYTAAAIGSDVVALLEALDERAFIVGTSMAAAAAVWAAAEVPKRVLGLVLSGPFVRDVPVNPLLTFLMRLMMLPLWGRAVWVLYYKLLYPSGVPADFAHYQALLRANLREHGRFEAFRAMMFASKAPCEARLPEVKARTLVVMGSKDPDFPKPAVEAQLVADRLSGQVFMADGCGHYPHAEQPDLVAPRLIEFFQEVAHA